MYPERTPKPNVVISRGSGRASSLLLDALAAVAEFGRTGRLSLPAKPTAAMARAGAKAAGSDEAAVQRIYLAMVEAVEPAAGNRPDRHGARRQP